LYNLENELEESLDKYLSQHNVSLKYILAVRFMRDFFSSFSKEKILSLLFEEISGMLHAIVDVDPSSKALCVKYIDLDFRK